MPPVSDEAGLRERKKLRTRADIVDAATRLFAERGFDAVTVEEITDACEVSPRTFYRYFPSKEDLVLGHIDESIERIRADLLARPDGEPVLASVRAAFTGLAHEIERDPQSARRLGALIRATPTLQVRRRDRQAIIEAALADTVAQRWPPGDADPFGLAPALIVGCAFTAFRVATRAWIEQEPAGSLTDLLDATFDLLAHGFA